MKQYKQVKYSFESKEQFDTLRASLIEQYQDEQPISDLMTIGGSAIVWLGRLVQTPATYNEQGEVITEAVLFDNYSADVSWVVKKDQYTYDEEGNLLETIVAVQDWESWGEFEIEPEQAKHNFI